MVTTKLGIIGLSEGNGHPFSWSSIINGYSPESLSTCGFPVIYDYMIANQHPNAGIRGAIVTSVFTQQRKLSEKIASCAKIPLIVNDVRKLVEKVDAVLLARDDAENHVFYAKDTLSAGLPIFIDKPIALTIDRLDETFGMASDKKLIYSCSALRFSNEILLSIEEREKIGKIIQINCVTPKSWDKYAIHLIDPLFHIMEGYTYTEAVLVHGEKRHRKLKVKWENGITTIIESCENFTGPIQFTYLGLNGKVTKIFRNSYHPFKKSLQFFIDNVNHNIFFDEYQKLAKMVKLIQIGRSL